VQSKTLLTRIEGINLTRTNRPHYRVLKIPLRLGRGRRREKGTSGEKKPSGGYVKGEKTSCR